MYRLPRTEADMAEAHDWVQHHFGFDTDDIEYDEAIEAFFVHPRTEITTTFPAPRDPIQ